MRSVPAGVRTCLRSVWLVVIALGSCPGFAADKLVGIHSARTMSQSMGAQAGFQDRFDPGDRG
jgi:hypothetical protein